MRSFRAVVPLGMLAAAFALTPARAQVPAGPSFMLSEGVGDEWGRNPAAALMPDGGYVAAWSSAVQNGQVIFDVFGRRFDRRGTPIGGEFRVSEVTTGFDLSATRPGVDALGNIVVSWVRRGGIGDRSYVRRFDQNGAPLGPEFRVEGAIYVGPFISRVGAAADGRFVVVWDASAVDPGGGVLARNFDAAGDPVGAYFVVNSYTTANQRNADLAAQPDGSFAVSWETYQGAASRFDIAAQRFDAAGNRIGGELQVNSYTTNTQYGSHLALAPDGSMVVTWTSLGGTGISARRFDAAGAPVGEDFQVATTGFVTSVSSDERGNFVIAWNVGPQGVKARRYFASGNPRGPEFVVADNLIRFSGNATITQDRVGNLLVTYFVDSLVQASHPRAQRYGGLVPQALDVDVSGNRVLEPGESVGVRPSWTNINGASQTFGSTAPAFAGPAGATYTVIDGVATYGAVADGATAECTDCLMVSVSDPPTRPVTHWDPILEELITPDAQGQDKLWRLHVGRSFSDVPASNPFYGFVETLLHRGVTGGCGDGLYCPSASTTREQMAVFVLTAKEGPSYSPRACGTPVFADVPAASPFCPWIEELSRRGVVGGCGGGNYCPAAAVTREQMAVFVLRTLDSTLDPPACAPPNLFTDVPETSPFCRWIEELANRGIVSGCGGGAYCPADAVTREQMGVFLGVTFGLTLYGP